MLYNIISYGFIDKSFKMGTKNLELCFNLRYNGRIRIRMKGTVMPTRKENYEFRTTWHEVFVDEYVMTSSPMTDFHAHDYYELSIILSGDVSVITGTVSSVGTQARAVLTRPRIPHFVSSASGVEYRRINVVFSEEFANALPERDTLLSVFPVSGGIMEFESASLEKIAEAARRIFDEKDSFRRLLLLAYLLSLLVSERAVSIGDRIPHHVTAALDFVNHHYSSHLTAEKIAKEVGVSRTTLLTTFKRYTGQTLGDYITQFRLYTAISMLREGATEYTAATLCGFGDASSLIRTFKRNFGTTPKKYLLSLNWSAT